MQRTSIMARTGFYLALLSLALLPLSVLVTRFAGLHFRFGLLLFTLAALAGFMAIAVAAFATRRQSDDASRRQLSRAAILGLPAVLTFGLNLFAGAGAPLIHDVTTAPDDPPAFEAALTQRTDSDNQPLYNAEIATLQRAAYPELVPIDSNLNTARAFERAVAVAVDLGWQVIARDQNHGHIEAVASTRWFGFKDDVVIRIRAQDEGSRIDLRSASRVGQGDLGANARRIRQFAARFADSSE